MFLAVNIGNSKINFAVFCKDKIIKTFSIDSDKNKNAYFYQTALTNEFHNYDISSCGIISVVNDLDKAIKPVCDKIFDINSVILSYKSADTVSINTNHPETVGMDRLANVYALSDSLLPAIVVDIGTAVTFDILSKEKVFLGGIIMPGVNMSLRGLHEGTSKLPEIEPKEPLKAIGNTTETCILSGVIRGTASAIDGLLEQCTEELGECETVILTGGQAELVSKYMHTKYPIDKDLTLKGIKKIYDLSC